MPTFGRKEGRTEGSKHTHTRRRERQRQSTRGKQGVECERQKRGRKETGRASACLDLVLVLDSVHNFELVFGCDLGKAVAMQYELVPFVRRGPEIVVSEDIRPELDLLCSLASDVDVVTSYHLDTDTWDDEHEQ